MPYGVKVERLVCDYREYTCLEIREIIKITVKRLAPKDPLSLTVGRALVSNVTTFESQAGERPVNIDWARHMSKAQLLK